LTAPVPSVQCHGLGRRFPKGERRLAGT
jgi:hypothetical protein